MAYVFLLFASGIADCITYTGLHKSYIAKTTNSCYEIWDSVWEAIVGDYAAAIYLAGQTTSVNIRDSTFSACIAQQGYGGGAAIASPVFSMTRCCALSCAAATNGQFLDLSCPGTGSISFTSLTHCGKVGSQSGQNGGLYFESVTGPACSSLNFTSCRVLLRGAAIADVTGSGKWTLTWSTAVTCQGDSVFRTDRSPAAVLEQVNLCANTILEYWAISPVRVVTAKYCIFKDNRNPTAGYSGQDVGSVTGGIAELIRCWFSAALPSTDYATLVDCKGSSITATYWVFAVNADACPAATSPPPSPVLPTVTTSPLATVPRSPIATVAKSPLPSVTESAVPTVTLSVVPTVTVSVVATVPETPRTTPTGSQSPPFEATFRWTESGSFQVTSDHVPSLPLPFTNQFGRSSLLGTTAQFSASCGFVETLSLSISDLFHPTAQFAHSAEISSSNSFIPSGVLLESPNFAQSGILSRSDSFGATPDLSPIPASPSLSLPLLPSPTLSVPASPTLSAFASLTQTNLPSSSDPPSLSQSTVISPAPVPQASPTVSALLSGVSPTESSPEQSSSASATVNPLTLPPRHTSPISPTITMSGSNADAGLSDPPGGLGLAGIVGIGVGIIAFVAGLILLFIVRSKPHEQTSQMVDCNLEMEVSEEGTSFETVVMADIFAYTNPLTADQIGMPDLFNALGDEGDSFASFFTA